MIPRVLEQFAGHAPDRIWLATTDADSRVPGSWLQDQLAFARRGFDAVAGTVRVHDWSGYTQQFVDAFMSRFSSGFAIPIATRSRMR
jgi:hypothetical protein